VTREALQCSLCNLVSKRFIPAADSEQVYYPSQNPVCVAGLQFTVKLCNVFNFRLKNGNKVILGIVHESTVKTSLSYQLVCENVCHIHIHIS
jgi:hypothetical protein